VREIPDGSVICAVTVTEVGVQSMEKPLLDVVMLLITGPVFAAGVGREPVQPVMKHENTNRKLIINLFIAHPNG